MNIFSGQSVRVGLSQAGSLLWDGGQRENMLKDAWKSVGKVVTLSVVLDVVYQIIVKRFVYP